MGKLLRLTNKLHNTPHLITDGYLNRILDYLEVRNDFNFKDVEVSITGGRQRAREELIYDEENKIGILNVFGPLTYMEYLPMCGEEPTSYQKLRSEAQQLIELGAKTIVMDIDSPGGEAYGCFEEAEAVRVMCDMNQVKLLGYVDGCAASGGYAWASVCHELYANPMAELGSIGVVVCLLNYSKMEKGMGIERRYITYGEEKVPFNMDGEFNPSFIQDIQEKVNSLGDTFTSHVADYRGISKESVVGTKAKMFTADKAVVLGLANAVMTRDEFFTYLTDMKEQENVIKFPWQKDSTSKVEQTEVADVAKLEEMQAAFTELSAKYEGLDAKLASVVTELGVKSEELKAALSALDAANAQLTEVKAAEKAAAELAEQDKAAKRLKVLQTIAGDEKGAQMATEMAAMSDSAFELVVSSMKVSAQAEQEQVDFKEVGLSGEGKSEEVKPVSFAAFMPKKSQKRNK